MIIDAHQHFWDKDRFDYPWLTPALGCLYNTFLPGDLEPMARRNGVQRTVVVQAMSSLEETRFLLGLADENDLIGGVVGWADLMDEGIAKTLGELCKNKKFKGLRHQIEDEPDREWLLRENVIRGLAEAARRGLCFDALLKQDQLWQLKTVAEKIPSLKIVIDHSAKPDIAGGGYDEWAGRIRAAAQLPVMCKLSGLLTEADHQKWTAADIKKYSDCVLGAFGEDRVMFGSDWPVSTMAADYDRSIAAAYELLADMSAAQREKILYLNAKRFYGLD